MPLLAARRASRYRADLDATKAALSERDQLLAALLEVQRASAGDPWRRFLREYSPPPQVQRASAGDGEDFYPDANGCLRLSAGHVEGYRAADAVEHTPVTTLGGLVDKHVEAALTRGGAAASSSETADEFACPPRLVELCQRDAAWRDTPACVLYSTDTVGGNSGSPVLDAEGRFVAINFDRQRLGLMNEFKWSLEYSRSIGTDVRYILLLVGEYDGAKWLVDEMIGASSA